MEREEIAAADGHERKRRERRAPTTCGCTGGTVTPFAEFDFPERPSYLRPQCF